MPDDFEDKAFQEAQERLASEAWQKFLDNRSAYLDRLAQPLVACAEHVTKRSRTKSTMCSSKDWPRRFLSAHALTRVWLKTGDRAHSDAAQRALNREVLAAARKDLERQGVGEDPHAFVWVLMAASNRQDLQMTTAVDEGLDALANDVARDLDAWVHGLADHELARGIIIGENDNVPWIVQNLWQWAQQRGDEALAQRMRQFTTKHLLDERYDAWCSPQQDAYPEPEELFAPSLHRALAVLTVVPEQHTDHWARAAFEGGTALRPLIGATWGTHAALNFSRSWGLWAIYRAIGDIDYKRAYSEHIMEQMDQSNWERINPHDAPEVAEFGIHAIELSYEL